MRKLLVIVLALWSGVAMAQVKTGTSIPTANQVGALDSIQAKAMVEMRLPFVSSAASLTASNNLTSATYDGSIWDLETSPLSPDNVTLLASKQAGYVWKRRYTHVSVKWKCFAGGAKGDGTTDDIAAINAATLYAKGRGTTVYFPTGTYLISAPILQYRGVRLLGEGYVWDSNCSKIKLKNGANCVMLKAGRAIQNIDTNDASFMSIEGIMFDGNGMNQTVENEGVQFWGQYVGSYLRNVFIGGVFGHALSLQSGLDLKIDHLWLLGNQSADGYGMVANQSLSSGQDGYLNMDHVYVEFQIKSSTPINVYTAPLSKRGVGMYLNRVITTNANELHFEYNAGGILFQDCFAANLGNVGVFGIGNGTDAKPGVIQLYQGDAVKSLSIHKGVGGGDVLGAVKWVSILNGTSNEVMEGPLLTDRQVLSGYISSATGSSPKPSLFYSPESIFANRIALQKVNNASPQSVDFLASDGTNAAGLHSHDFDFRIGSSRYQPGNSFKNFLTINSYGGSSDNVTFGVQTLPVNLTASSGLLTGANFRFNGIPSFYDGASVLSYVTSSSGTAAPTSAPGWAGQTYVDATNNLVYTATGNSSSANWFALNLWANIKNKPTSLSQFINDLGYGTMATQSANNVALAGGSIGGSTAINTTGSATQAISGTTTNGSTLLSINQYGTARALSVNRQVANATRPVMAIVQNIINGAQPSLVVQQDDSNQPAIQTTNSGGAANAAIYGDGRMIHTFSSGSADPTTSTLAAGQCILWKNTTAGTIKWYCNDGGTIKAGAAFN